MPVPKRELGPGREWYSAPEYFVGWDEDEDDEEEDDDDGDAWVGWADVGLGAVGLVDAAAAAVDVVVVVGLGADNHWKGVQAQECSAVHFDVVVAYVAGIAPTAHDDGASAAAAAAVAWTCAQGQETELEPNEVAELVAVVPDAAAFGYWKRFEFERSEPEPEPEPAFEFEPAAVCAADADSDADADADADVSAAPEHASAWIEVVQRHYRAKTSSPYPPSSSFHCRISSREGHVPIRCCRKRYCCCRSHCPWWWFHHHWPCEFHCD